MIRTYLLDHDDINFPAAIAEVLLEDQALFTALIHIFCTGLGKSARPSCWRRTQDQQPSPPLCVLSGHKSTMSPSECMGQGEYCSPNRTWKIQLWTPSRRGGHHKAFLQNGAKIWHCFLLKPFQEIQLVYYSRKENSSVSISHGHLRLNHGSGAEPGRLRTWEAPLSNWGRRPKHSDSPRYYCFHELYSCTPENLSIKLAAS